MWVLASEGHGFYDYRSIRTTYRESAIDNLVGVVSIQKVLILKIGS